MRFSEEIMEYRTFLERNLRFLAFGLLMTGFSGFGQTFFVAIFNSDIRSEFELTHGEFGSIYAVATLASGTLMFWLGRMIDHVDLRIFTLLTCLFLIFSCFSMALAPTLALLYFALFSVRLAGQGLMSHTGMTSMGRYFGNQRGKAVSIAALGYPLGAASLPLIGVFFNETFGWRLSWGFIGCVLIPVLLPTILWLLKGHKQRHQQMTRISRKVANVSDESDLSWTRSMVLQDIRFYLILPAVLAPGYIMTGFFFHQVHLVESKGWSMNWFATSFIAYSLTTIISSLSSGPLIDRKSAWRLLPCVLPPLGLALILLSAGNHPFVAIFFMLAAGITVGVNYSLFAALWAELYGTTHLGAIRSLVATLTVISTALAPFMMGWMIDEGISMERIALACVAYIVLANTLVYFAHRIKAIRTTKTTTI